MFLWRATWRNPFLEDPSEGFSGGIPLTDLLARNFLEESIWETSLKNPSEGLLLLKNPSERLFRNFRENTCHSRRYIIDRYRYSEHRSEAAQKTFESALIHVFILLIAVATIHSVFRPWLCTPPEHLVWNYVLRAKPSQVRTRMVSLLGLCLLHCISFHLHAVVRGKSYRIDTLITAGILIYFTR